MKVRAKLKNLRISPRKVRVSVDMIRGCMLGDAIFKLKNKNRRANDALIKLLNSAKANAVNNFKLSEDSLRVSEIMVGEGLTLKRWRPRAYGRASQILKRSSHVYLTLEVVKNKVGNSIKDNDSENKKSDKMGKVSDGDKTEGSEKIVKKVKKENKKILEENKRSYKTTKIKRKEEM